MFWTMQAVVSMQEMHLYPLIRLDLIVGHRKRIAASELAGTYMTFINLRQDFRNMKTSQLKIWPSLIQ